ncbi:MAG: hypothetical protein KDK78_01295, partial [Chlamydiia bacterium]|nr:hypothetical protein [Chlamydiia bacterium]
MQIHSSFHANLNKALSEKLPYELHWKEGQHTHQNTPCPHSRCCNLHVLPHAKRYGVLKDPSSAPTTEAKVELCRILLREMREPQVAPEVVKSTSRFLRSIKKGDVDPELSSVLAQLRDEHLAQRFGINVRVLEDNPGLADFLERNHLYYALKHYGHRIEVREETGEALLIMEGEWRDWTWIQNRVEQEAPQPPGPSQRPNWENVRYGSEAICKYTFEGIRLGPVTQWDTLEPF